MKKTVLLLSAFAFSAVALANVATPPAQERALAEWVKEKLTVEQVQKKAMEFNKKMNADEGIGCVHKSDNGKYITTVNPDAKKMQNPELTPDMQKVLDKILVSLKDKKVGEAGWVKNFEFEGKKKDGVAYRIDDRDICMAFWVVSDKTKR